MTAPVVRRVTLFAVGLAVTVAISLVLGSMDSSHARHGREVVFSHQVTTRMGGGLRDEFAGRLDYLGLGYRVRVWKSINAGPMVPVPRDSVGADPNCTYTRRGAELRFVFLPYSFEAVHHLKWLTRDVAPPPVDRSGGS